MRFFTSLAICLHDCSLFLSECQCKSGSDNLGFTGQCGVNTICSVGNIPLNDLKKIFVAKFTSSGRERHDSFNS